MMSQIDSEPTNGGDLSFTVTAHPHPPSCPCPHRCPVCWGVGLVDETFYYRRTTFTSTGVGHVLCRSCGGTGIVWHS
jgi:hypothetical protein